MKELMEVDLKGSLGSSVKNITYLSLNRRQICAEEFTDIFDIELEFQNGTKRRIHVEDTYEQVVESSCFGSDSVRWERKC